MLEDLISPEFRLKHLAERMQRDDEAAAAQLYDDLASKVFGFCFARLRDRDKAEDLTQEIFLKLVSKIKMFDGARGSFLSWFWQLVRNVLIDEYRKNQTQNFSNFGEDMEEVEKNLGMAIQVESPERTTEYRLERSHLDKFLTSLSQEEQELFRLRYVAELPYDEIAKIMGKPPGTIRVASSRLKSKVKKNIRHENT